MRFVIAGGTGFIGRALTRALIQRKHEVIILSRSQKPGHGEGFFIKWNPQRHSQWTNAVRDIDALINLAGESLAGGRWTASRKKALLDSRMDSTRTLVDGMAKLEPKPRAFLSASGVGYYGPQYGAPVDESIRPGSDFLAKVCRQWEQEALRAEEIGVRTVIMRFGLVLGKGGGFLGKMLLPFKLGLGGPLGSGHQWMSWIQIDDLIEMMLFLLNKPSARGPINAVAPHPVSNAEFTRILASVLRRPAFFRVPQLVLRLGFGEMGQMLLTGQNVAPKKALSLGFSFRHPNLKDALRHTL